MTIVESTYRVDNSVYYTKSYLKSNGSFLHSVVKFIIFFLMLLSIYYLASGNANTFTFSNFLNYLQNIPSLQMPSSFFGNLIINDSWGFFDFFRVTINLFTGLLSVLAYVGISLVQVVLFVTYSLGFLFA